MATVSPQTCPEQPWTYSLQLPHDPRAPRIARTTLRAVLGGHGMAGLMEVAELLACEMVTNAYRHAEGPSAMRLRNLDGRLRISVWDTNPTIPPPFDRPPGPEGGSVLRPVDVEGDDSDGDGGEGRVDDRDHGRGLLLVRRWADNWGGRPLGDDLFGTSGKLLWIELAQPGGFAIAA